jgi:hypothetical protein
LELIAPACERLTMEMLDLLALLKSRLAAFKESTTSEFTDDFAIFKRRNLETARNVTMRIASSSLSCPGLFAVDFHLLDGHVVVC